MRKRLGLLALLVCGVWATTAAGAQQAPPPLIEVRVASGELGHHALSDELFHIGELWMQVVPDTEFHRWLSRGIDKDVAVIVTPDPARFGDSTNVRILTGKLIHQSIPLDNDIMHVLFLQDGRLGSLGAITFQTEDPATAMKFAPYDDATVSIVIVIG